VTSTWAARSTDRKPFTSPHLRQPLRPLVSALRAQKRIPLPIATEIAASKETNLANETEAAFAALHLAREAYRALKSPRAGKLDTLFETAARLLRRDGVMLLHSMAQPTKAPYNQPFIEKYIFPGGYIPAGDLAKIHPPRVFAHAVGHRRKILSRNADVPAVRQVASRWQTQAHDRVARFAKRQIHRQVRGRTRVRLHVRVVGPKQGFRSTDAEFFHLVDELLAFVVPLARITLAVLVRERGTQRL